MTPAIQFGGELGRALARPPQRRLRITPGVRIHQSFQVRRQLRVQFREALPSSPRPSDPIQRQPRWLATGPGQFPKSPMKGTPVEAGGLGHIRDPSVPQAAGFSGRPPAESGLIKASLQHSIFLAQLLHVNRHVLNIAQNNKYGTVIFARLLSLQLPLNRQLPTQASPKRARALRMITLTRAESYLRPFSGATL